MENLLNAAKYAEHVNRDKSLIYRWMMKGEKINEAVVKRRGKRLINVDLADEIIKETLDVSQSRSPGVKTKTKPNKKSTKKAKKEDEKKGIIPEPKPGSKNYSYSDALIKDKYYAAALKKIKLDQENNILVLKSEVEKDAFDLARQIRDALQNIASRISAILASMTDENKIEDLIDKEITQALESLISIDK